MRTKRATSSLENGLSRSGSQNAMKPIIELLHGSIGRSAQLKCSLSSQSKQESPPSEYPICRGQK
eukprot:scaffold5828_cov168-Amphora_coffeaeformis.AAC.26